MQTNDLYPYATGSLIDKPNTYFYTVYGGEEFIEAWQTARKDVKNSLPRPLQPPPAVIPSGVPSDGNELLELAFAGDADLQEAFRRKFEFTKRVHGGYDEKFRAIDRKDCKVMARYMRAADVFELAYSHNGSMRELNVLLKCIDTLCAYKNDLDGELRARLAWHLSREKAHLEALAAKVL